MNTKYKRFLIHCSTSWCGMDETYGAYAEKESDLYALADELAYDNFNSYDCRQYIAEEMFDDVDEMSDEDWDSVYEVEAEYYNSVIEEFTGDEDE